MLTRNLISILSISPPIKSTIFSPCFKINASSSSTVENVLTSYKILLQLSECTQINDKIELPEEVDLSPAYLSKI